MFMCVICHYSDVSCTAHKTNQTGNLLSPWRKMAFFLFPVKVCPKITSLQPHFYSKLAPFVFDKFCQVKSEFYVTRLWCDFNSGGCLHIIIIEQEQPMANFTTFSLTERPHFVIHEFVLWVMALSSSFLPIILLSSFSHRG